MTVTAPVKNTKVPCGYEMVQLELFEPHTIVSYLFDHCGVQIDEELVKVYWDHHRSVQSPWVQNCDATSRHVPLALFGDGARCRQQTYKKVEKVFGFFISLPLWRPKSARFSRWLLFSIDESLLFGRKTLNCVLARITWSINLLFWGLWPTHGPCNEEIDSRRKGQQITADGRVFALTELRGDWSYFKQLFGLQSSWKAGTNASVCFKCSAWGIGPPSHQYYHIGPRAHVWTTEYSLASFLANEMPETDVCILTEKFVFRQPMKKKRSCKSFCALIPCLCSVFLTLRSTYFASQFPPGSLEVVLNALPESGFVFYS